MGQEPGAESEVKAFARSKGFLDPALGDASAVGAFNLMRKCDVSGAAVDPVFSYLKREAPCKISWNFGAYFLVSRDGVVEAHENAHPRDLAPRVEALLGAVDAADVDVAAD